MKLILTSNLITSPLFVNKIIEFIGKSSQDIKIAIINEAYAVENGPHNWLLENFHVIKKYFKDSSIEFVNLLALDIKTVEARLERVDVIICLGGNTEYLQTVFEKTGFDKLLRKLINTKIFVGVSAGSCIVGKLPSIETLSAIYEVTDLFGIKDYLSYFNFSILPHTGKKYFNDKFQVCLNESKKQSYPVYSLSDTSALIIEDDKEYMIGEDCYKLLNGHIIEKID